VRPGHATDHSPPSSAAVMEEQSYTSTHPLGHTGPVTETLYLYKITMPVPVAARSKALVCGRSPTEIVCSNPTGGMDACLL